MTEVSPERKSRDKDLRSLQVQADIYTFICAICFALLVYVAENPPQGAAALGLVIPFTVVVLLHLSLGIGALVCAVSTGRFYRNLWIYAYFTIVVLTTFYYTGIHKSMYRSVLGSIERIQHPVEYQMFDAMSGRDEAAAVAAVASGARVDYCFENLRRFREHSAVQMATMMEQESLLTALLEAGADPDGYCMPEPQGPRTALTEAIRKKNLAMTRALLEAGAEPNPGDRDYSPLGFAISTDSNLPNPNYGRWKPEPAALKDVRKLTALLLDAGADPDAPHYKAVPLQWAVVYDDIQLIDMLLAAGADTSVPFAESRQGLMTLAVQYDADTVLDALASLGFSMEGSDVFFALRYAGQRRDEITLSKIAILGVNLGAFYDEEQAEILNQGLYRSIDLTTEMFEAVRGSNVVYLDALLAAGARINWPADNGRLLVTLVAHDADQLALVLRKGALVDGRLSGGRTSLHYFAGCRHCTNPLPAMQNLVASGADVNARDERGKTPTDYAKDARQSDTRRYLESVGGEITRVRR